ncbi:MAG: hypothetical protein WBD63_08650 [Phycisphaerae bacterium]|nr:hypothetical protein [Phycisphaerae bacterium]
MAGFFLHKGIPDKMRIARFVDMNACKSIFSEHSTFVLRSAEHYRRMETSGAGGHDKNDRGDDREGEVRRKGGGSAEAGGFVLSCWTILDGDEPKPKEWKIFPDSSVVAIISTPDKVCAMLKNAFEIEDGRVRDGRRFPFMCVEHKAVAYADEVAEEIGPDNIMDIPVFTKRLRFAPQKEYRFALYYSIMPHVIDSYFFAPWKPEDYMDECWANPAMCRKDKEELWLILSNVMCGYGHFARKKMGEIIANADILLDR